MAKLQADTSIQLQNSQLAQQQKQFDTGEQNWKDQFGLSEDQFNEQKSEWMKQFNQNEDNFHTNMDFQTYWNNRNMQFQGNSNVLAFQSGIFNNPNLTPEQRTAALNNGMPLTSAYVGALQQFPDWVPPWQQSTANYGSRSYLPATNYGTPQHP